MCRVKNGLFLSEKQLMPTIMEDLNGRHKAQTKANQHVLTKIEASFGPVSGRKANCYSDDILKKWFSSLCRPLAWMTSFLSAKLIQQCCCQRSAYKGNFEGFLLAKAFGRNLANGEKTIKTNAMYTETGET